MKITRVYSDARGESRFADLDIPLEHAGDIGSLSRAFPARAVVFRTTPPGYNFDWHPAPQRQIIVLLDGEIEIEVSAGDKRRFKGGEILLVEDTAGRGHKTRNIQPIHRRSIFIHLDDDTRFDGDTP